MIIKINSKIMIIVKVCSAFYEGVYPNSKSPVPSTVRQAKDINGKRLENESRLRRPRFGVRHLRVLNQA